ncbi:MAG: excinuclease ABC subunit UvrC [Oscillospiraceae bacterium]|nr:excinuclease ABC subunit UvrC [Oscillospiraceae bacterium]
MTLEQLKEKARALPLKPGVYLMQDKQSRVIYVGKAKALKNRVSQYFNNMASHTEKTRAMVSQIDHFDVIIADSEFEALVLENSLIKRHKPKYNILLKDDKGYPFIRLDLGEPYPRLAMVSRTEEGSASYFGPYGGRSVTADLIDALQAALKLPACSKVFPRDIGKERPCLNYRMGRCAGWCRPELTQEEYRRTVDQAVRLLNGDFAAVLRDLREEMDRASEQLHFERAAELRDRCRAIELLSQKQKVLSGPLADTDVIGFYRGDARSCFVVLHFLEGQLAAKDWSLLDTPMEEDNEVVSSLVRQYFTPRGRLPRTILLPCPLEDQESLAALLSEQAGRRVELAVPKRGAKADLVRMAGSNAREEAERATSRQERTAGLLERLGTLLALDAPPRRIEAFDISNTGASVIVASMVVFADGKPRKSDYRRFKVNGLSAPDDYTSMSQVVTRRFTRLLAGEDGWDTRPDLLLIDGGSVHAGVAKKALEELGLDIPVFGLVKDQRHRTRALAAPGGQEIGILHDPSLFAFLGTIQEEAHRFAVTYNRSRHGRSVRGSELDSIPGVGPKRRAALLKELKSIKAIRQADPEQLSRIVDRKTARAVYDHFHGSGEGDPTV